MLMSDVKVKLSLIIYSLLLITTASLAQGDQRGIIVFVGSDQDGTTLQMVNASDGSGLRTLLSAQNLKDAGIVDISNPKGSPDGTQILFTAFMASGDFEVFTFKINTVSLQNISNDPQSINIDAIWHSDGTSIIFASDRDSDNLNIWQLKLESGLLSPIFESVCNDSKPSLAPDGEQLAFTRQPSSSSEDEADCNQHIWVFSLGDSGLSQITLGTDNTDTAPVWSPDSNQVIYQSSIDGASDIFLVDLEAVGDNQRNLTQTGQRNETNPSWSPDGKSIIFTSSILPQDRTESNPIVFNVIRLDLSQASVPTNITENLQSSARQPNWLAVLGDCEDLLSAPCNTLGTETGSVSASGETQPQQGNRIVAEGACVYIVRAGDNFFRIALRHGYNVDELLPYNTHLGNHRRIFRGNEIYIPDCSRPSRE